MIKVSALSLGRVFGLGVVAVSAFACGGTAFSGSAPDPDATDMTDTVMVPNHGTSTGGKASPPTAKPSGADGGADTEPQPQPPRGGTGGASTTGGGGSAGTVPPDDGLAGEPNIPDLPVDPNCASPLAEDWTAALDSSGSEWKTEFGDPWVDAANHRLVVTYDDVASHTTAYEGGYYVSAEVTLTGGTVLTPYPYANEGPLPSLRRNSNGTGIELGSAKYGSTEHWASSDWKGFSGVTIAGTTTVVVTTYIKATAQAVAMKVSYGGQQYRSGWVSGFTWPKTNLGIMRYVGQNNSSVFAGDAVYVGPLRGCQKLDDAALETLFQN